jgi:hypothetical protein
VFVNQNPALVPVVTNYVNECFTGRAQEVTTALNFYRLVLGLTVPFYITPWLAAVGVGWTFGISRRATISLIPITLTSSLVAFVSLVGFSFTIILAWKGHVIRQYSMERFRQDEEGEALFSG